ncbi:hypothetical protein, partial [Legionella impletisoli]|uniref:hypothetical protein n=1 Tax=Legionella impletisoli TaxID=343510 RepID=UPI00166BF319
MTACKHFLTGIEQINFATESAKRLRQILLTLAIKELKAEEQSQRTLLSKLPDVIEHNPIAEKPLKLLKQQLSSQIESIHSRIALIQNEAEASGLKLHEDIELDDSFIKAFAENFRNIPHLANTLSDAPPEIKTLQTKLYSVIFFKLDQNEQEQQLASLSTGNIQDMVNQALLTYNTSSDLELKAQSQQLVHMGLFELIRRESLKVQESAQRDYSTYLAFTRKLHHMLPDVGESDVIDYLSDYQSSDGQSIAQLLYNVRERLKTQNPAWDDDKQIESAKESRALFHKLRFGQGDRREYLAKRKANMQRDLFWARTIQDTELFTQSKESELEFQRLEELRSLREDTQFKIAQGVKTRTFPKKKLEMAFREVFKQRKDKNLPLGNTRDPLVQGEKDYTSDALALIEEAFNSQMSKPVITIDEHGQIKAEFIYIGAASQTILDAITAGGGFGRTPDSISDSAFALEGIQSSIVTHAFKGKTLDEIESQIQALEDETLKHSFSEALANVKQSTSTLSISDLQLRLSEELVLRKLLELHLFYSHKPPIPEELKEAFAKLEQSAIEALKIPNLEQTVNQHFTALAELSEETVSSDIRPVVRKAKTMVMSNAERARKIETFNQAFKSERTTKSMLKALFQDEYHAMSDRLKLTQEEIRQMDEDIDSMVDEFLLLYERTKKGQPVLSKAEEEAYFSVIRQLAEQVKPNSLADYQFKLLHSSTGRQMVKLTTLTGDTKQLQIDLGRIKLPYSLIKPPGESEFIFSYGGSRGIIAPFAGLSEALGSPKNRKRLFTHSRLLGVGQYGTVKEVEGLLTGLNRVIKEGYAPTHDNKPIFEDQLRENLLSRPITSREDPLYRIESDILQAFSSATQESHDSLSQETQYWLKDKEKRTKTVKQYQILTSRAKGDTYADTASHSLNRYSKTDLAYHNPLKRPQYDNLTTLKTQLALSEALVQEAERFHELGFAHNDIKPENFLYKRDANGHFSVQYIDWATGGFKRSIDPRVLPGEVAGEKKIETLFKTLFGEDLPYSIKDNRCFDLQGRFVSYDPETNRYSYGVNPSLEILHGARNGTLPYISPTVMGENRNKSCLPAGVRDPSLNTELLTHDSTMDNWALTAMTFGVCNTQAYFSLVRGRVVSDYVVPEILDVDNETPKGLKIVNHAKFNQFFAVDKITAKDLTTGRVYTQNTGVMYIPGNPREGEPLHLYRHLEALRAQCSKKEQPSEAEEAIIQNIDDILGTVHDAVSSGQGLSKEDLQRQFTKAKACIEQFQQLNDKDFLASLDEEALLNSILAKYRDKQDLTANDLLQKTSSGISELEILSTYPKTASQQEKALAILDKALTPADLTQLCFDEEAPYSHLLKTCMAKNQTLLTMGLLAKVNTDNPSFIQQVHDQGLLHFAFQQGQTDVAQKMIEALERAGQTDPGVFYLMALEYGPGEDQLPDQHHIQWSSNTLHIAIRNHNKEQLSLILDRLPEGYESIITESLHQAALLSHPDFYQAILLRHNERNPEHEITVEKIVSIAYPPDDSSPYHLFLRDEATLDAIDWEALTSKQELAKTFLLQAPENTQAFPLLITTQAGNYIGLERLLTLGDAVALTEEGWQAFFLQTDANGKNILNHTLEQGRYEELTLILNAIKLRCKEKSSDVLITLLSNPNPLNPLQNFLATEKVTESQYRIVSEILDAISNDYTKASKKEQEARIIALLVNKDWLFEQAETNPEALRALLQNNSLSLPYKQLLFKQLKEKSPKDSVAERYFNDRLDEVTPKVTETEERKVNLGLSSILGEVTKQSRGDLSDLIEALTQNSNIGAAVKAATLEFTTKIRDLEDQLAEEKRKLTKATNELQAQTARAEASEEKQRQIQDELTKAQANLAHLNEEAESLTASHRAEVQSLQDKILQASEEAKTTLAT